MAGGGSFKYMIVVLRLARGQLYWLFPNINFFPSLSVLPLLEAALALRPFKAFLFRPPLLINLAGFLDSHTR